MNKQFKNKTVLITGGVQGIGFECKSFIFGSKVIVTCKSQASYDFFRKFYEREYSIRKIRFN